MYILFCVCFVPDRFRFGLQPEPSPHHDWKVFLPEATYCQRNRHGWQPRLPLHLGAVEHVVF